jgi:hypothetical protein
MPLNKREPSDRSRRCKPGGRTGAKVCPDEMLLRFEPCPEHGLMVQRRTAAKRFQRWPIKLFVGHGIIRVCPE